jgi:hypothetical protein
MRRTFGLALAAVLVAIAYVLIPGGQVTARIASNGPKLSGISQPHLHLHNIRPQSVSVRLK